MTLKFIFKKMLLPIVIAVVAFFLVNHDSFLYQAPVGKITVAKTISSQEVSDDFQNKDRQITQNLTVKLLNGKINGQSQLRLKNTVTLSQTTGQLYRVGQRIILKKVSGVYQIVTLKRDALIVALLVLFVGFLLSFQRLRASIFLLLSLALNLLYFALVIGFNVAFNPPVLLLFGLLAALFAASSLVFVLGFTRQMFYTFVTTALTTLLTFVLVFLVLHWTGNRGVHFEYLEYVTQNPSEFFFVGTMISVLGAIMDGTGDIVAGLFGLARQNVLNEINMTQKDYFKSGISIGQEIIGTLTNVLFMIFMAEALPMTLLLLRNGNTWGYIATVGLNLGLLQTVISAIGIVLAVPITAFVTSWGLKHSHKKELIL
ncbi:YibE/F family protein [Lactococcus kimchii]|uniref:YibE/F family protein n=1 Tax=Lactococcus sp. S-13 TaxID=2507158 RepID=UPI00102324C7|nr:YibE/F family protein [Lactococcus sp. S-13]RZI48540.1 YibE/F family protein [Lactococcus sp. S-13]